ncbi:MAG: DoxX family protein [Proteobacteria bacterium]|nr:DoxX family protein [Pseudomonadota bacterium]
MPGMCCRNALREHNYDVALYFFMMLAQLRNTSNDKIACTLRILLGLVFFMAGILKVVVPHLGEAFAGQLIAANIPFHNISLYAFPVVEMVLGLTLLFGLHARLSAAIAAVTMVVAAYVHLAVEDPSLFPLQPVEPIGPFMLLAMLLYVLWKGAGAWSVDLRESE